GCATVTRGTTESVQFSSTPDGARVKTSLGTECTTPCEMEIERKQKFEAVFTLGNDVRRVMVGTQVQEGGAAGLAGNVLIGGVIGIGVDAATGASLNHIPNPVVADFTKPAPQPTQLLTEE
ncbi:hypothetical protein, partial [Sulfitobacter pontiacus]|uniref:hypothetical protein n=1 Tax=Sulfitobacter pontiacus TaxID=60137 RepID=UPI003267A194